MSSYTICMRFNGEWLTSDGLERLKYNHPGLVVDLGVGLWAWPLPMDFDGDGDLDLVVNCPDKPYNGVYFFENPGDARTSSRSSSPAGASARGCRTSRSATSTASRGCCRRGTSIPTSSRPAWRSRAKLPLPAERPSQQGPRRTCGSYVDYDGDGELDLIVGVETGPSTAGTMPTTRPASGPTGRCAGFVYLLRNTGTTATSRRTPSR